MPKSSKAKRYEDAICGTIHELDRILRLGYEDDREKAIDQLGKRLYHVLHGAN